MELESEILPLGNPDSGRKQHALTRHLCADPAVTSADSTANADHPMINPIWRGRFAIGDVLIPLATHDPVVPMIHAALVTRNLAREAGRSAVRFIRTRKFS
jgi:hypothetical protein